MVRVHHLTERYQTVTAVDDNLRVEAGPGRVTGFLGPNGAGKTTTLPILPWAWPPPIAAPPL